MANGSAPLHVQQASLAVQWPLDVDADVHYRVVPDLLRWCRWDRDNAWADLRRTLPANRRPATTPLPRHVRLAQVLDFVGRKAEERGESAASVQALCRQSAEMWSLGQLRAEYDPITGDVCGTHTP